jgi:hypothetical protein
MWLRHVLGCYCSDVRLGFVASQAPTATIRGVVLDPSQAAVPQAKVTVEHTATGFARTAFTGQLGDYLFPALAPGGVSYPR